jgi:hypothetical protein
MKKKSFFHEHIHRRYQDKITHTTLKKEDQE